MSKEIKTTQCKNLGEGNDGELKMFDGRWSICDGDEKMESEGRRRSARSRAKYYLI